MQLQPEIEFVHNRDLDPPASYISSLPLIGGALRYDQLVASFQGYDAIANSSQRVLRSTGLLSLLLGAAALTGLTAKLLLGNIGLVMAAPAVLAIELTSIAAIALAVGPWFAKTRTRWLTARYVTEQLRQWHFQLLLDGSLASLWAKDRLGFEAERRRRWDLFRPSLSNAEGTLTSFVDGESLAFHHGPQPCSDAAVSEELSRAYMDLRIEKQLAFFHLRREALSRHDEWLEAAAKWTLLTAVILSAAHALLVLLEMNGTHLPSVVGACLAAVALWLVIVAASLRVYQSAMRISEQRERYDTSWVRLVSLKNEFTRARDSSERLLVMRDVELIAVEELREFLRQMRRASYLL